MFFVGWTRECLYRCALKGRGRLASNHGRADRSELSALDLLHPRSRRTLEDCPTSADALSTFILSPRQENIISNAGNDGSSLSSLAESFPT